MPATHFTPALFTFLTELAANNDRQWLRANKPRYDADVKEPASASSPTSPPTCPGSAPTSAPTGAWRKASGDRRFRRSFELAGDSLIRGPKGFSPGHPLIVDLRRKDFIGVAHISEDAVLSHDFMEVFAGLCRDAAPFQRWLCQALRVPF